MPSSAKCKEWADRIFQHIPSNPADDPISLYDLAAVSFLSTVQVRHGIAWLREHHPDLPLVTYSRGGYKFVLEAAPVHGFTIRQVSEGYLKIMRACYGAEMPYLRKTADPTTIRLVDKSVTRILEDLQDLLKLVS